MLYLPPYSPDYNPIEKCFGKMKYMLKRKRAFGDIRLRIKEALDCITSEDVAGYFRYSDY